MIEANYLAQPVSCFLVLLQVYGDPACTDYENVSVLELNILCRSAGFDLVECDRPACERVIGLIQEAPYVQKYTSSNFKTLSVET